MSFRACALLAFVLLAACDREVAPGPEREQPSAFVYSKAMQAGQTLQLRNMAGSLEIEPATDDTLRVVADLHWRGDAAPPSTVQFRGDATTDGVLVCAVFGDGTCTADDYQGKSDGTGFKIGRNGISLGLGGPSQASAHFRVRVPAGVKLDLTMLDGNVRSASSAPVKVRGVNGDITVVTSVGPVNAKSVNGSIDARMTTLAGTDSVLVEIVNGDAFAFIPESANATTDVGTVNGKVTSDFAAPADRSGRRENSLTGVVGTGATPVRVRSVNGDAQLRRLDAQGRAYDVTTPPRN